VTEEMLVEIQLECCDCRMLNIIPMVSTKKIAIQYAQKEMRKGFKHATTKISNKYKTKQ
jgi:hypothetical protein